MLKRILRINFQDGSYKDCTLSGVSSLPDDFKQSLSLNQTKQGFHLCYSESLIEDFSTVESITVIRNG